MTDPIHEQLSAFLDGELSAAESELLLKRVARDPELKVRLEHYVLAGEALRATAVQPRPARDFSARVAAAIDNDSVPSVRAVTQWLQPWLKPIAGGAIAAGVAAVALVALQIAPSSTLMQAAQQPTAAPQNTVLANSVVPNAQPSGTSTINSGASYTVPTLEHRTAPPIQVVHNGRLANFVVAHSEYSSPLARRNVLTGLVAEDLPADQPVDSFVVEQLAIDDAALPPPVSQPDASRGMLSRAPR